MSSRTRLAAVGATAVALPVSVIASSYVVHPGDTLQDIAIRHGTTVSALASANEISNPAFVRVGQLLHIPSTSLGLPAYVRDAPDSESYAVQRGDSIISIAHRYGVDPTALARANGLNVNTPLDIGVSLQVPGRLARVNALLSHVAGEIGTDANLLKAVAWMESGWQQNFASATGAVGLMQIEAFTGEWVSTYLAGRPLNLQVAHDNVLAGGLLLQHLLTVHNGDVSAALGAYYQGDASIAKDGLFDDTHRYVNMVNELATAPSATAG